MLKKTECDIVLGYSDDSLKYARINKCVVLVDTNITKEKYLALIDEGYVVLKKEFSKEFLTSSYFNKNNKYNLISLKQKETVLTVLETYIEYIKISDNKNIKLYIEIEDNKIETIKREIIEKNKVEEYITTFSFEELLTREFIEQNPITSHLPLDFIDEDASIKHDKTINVIFIGFNELSRKLYNYYIINNQLVTFKDGEYKLMPINYYIYDNSEDKSNMFTINGLKEELKKLDKNEYFTLPELPYNTEYNNIPNYSHDCVNYIKDKLQDENSFTYIFVDTLDIYQNIEMGANLKIWLADYHNYHVYVKNNKQFTKNDDMLSYYGNEEIIYNHDIIIKDGLMLMAKKMNEVYTMQALKQYENDVDFMERVKSVATQSWNNFDYFTIYSNMFSSINLRLKLNLLKLNYMNDGKMNDLDLIDKMYPLNETNYKYDDYSKKNTRNALLAQEHARWNAYHLVNGFMPLKKQKIEIKKIEENNVSFIIKNVEHKKHACLTTFKGLDELSCYLKNIASEKVGKEIEIDNYDYYKYDESLILNSKELLRILKYSVVDKNK